MIRTLAALSLLPFTVHAGPYVEIGIAKADGGTCIEDRKDDGSIGCSTSPLGNLSVGYQWRGFTLSAEHWSSFQEKDRGLNLFAVKYRWEFGK